MLLHLFNYFSRYRLVTSAVILATLANFVVTSKTQAQELPSNWPSTYPNWWYLSTDPANGVINAIKGEANGFNNNNAGILNQGQLWNIAYHGINELNSQLSLIGGAGFTLDDFKNGNAPSYYSPANLGQLKNVSSKFYDRFAQIGFSTSSTGWPATLNLNNNTGYPWTNNVTPDNLKPANLGQAKHLFSWDVSLWEALSNDLIYQDTDGDGWTDYEEYILGTDPNDSSDGLGNIGSLANYLDQSNNTYTDQASLGGITLGQTNSSGSEYNYSISITDLDSGSYSVTATDKHGNQESFYDYNLPSHFDPNNLSFNQLHIDIFLLHSVDFSLINMYLKFKPGNPKRVVITTGAQLSKGAQQDIGATVSLQIPQLAINHNRGILDVYNDPKFPAYGVWGLEALRIHDEVTYEKEFNITGRKQGSSSEFSEGVYSITFSPAPPAEPLTGSGTDAVGPKYRKVALNGRPMSDEQPQQEEETDLADEQTYIDAYNLNLNYNNSFIYTPIANSDLVLQANLSATETIYNKKSSLYPEQQLTLPFGTSWSSNLSCYAELVINNHTGGIRDDLNSVTIIDEAGRSQRFGTLNQQDFYPWPSGVVDKKTYLNKLTKSANGDLVYTKKFGNTLTYEPISRTHTYNSDRINNDGFVNYTHTYWRLKSVTDRYGNSLSYNYGGLDDSLIPATITSNTNQSITIARNNDGTRVNSITDSLGNTTSFSYVGVDDLNLRTVSYADGSQVNYTYNDYQFDINRPSNGISEITEYHHFNLKSITNKRGHTYTFNYQHNHSTFSETIISGEAPTLETIYGLPMRISSVKLPDGQGTSTFATGGDMVFSFVDAQASDQVRTITDATGNQTIYNFTDIEVESTDQDGTNKEWMVYYLTSSIAHADLGTETYTYDKPSGLTLKSSTDFSGNITTWEYAEDFDTPVNIPLQRQTNLFTKWADPTSKTDALGRTESYSYGNYRIMSQINDVHGTVTNFNVDNLGRRTNKTVTDSNGNKFEEESYAYTNTTFPNFKTQTTKVAYSNLSGQPWEQSLITTYSPDARGNVVSMTVDPNGEALTTSYTYDLNNNKLSSTDARGNTTTFTYDSLNRLTQVTYPVAGTSTGEVATTKSIIYDLDGNIAAEIDEEGNYTIHHYDALNRKVATIRDMDGLGLPTVNANGLVENDKGTATPADLVTTITYNAVNSVVQTTDPQGNISQTTYDALQRPTLVTTAVGTAEETQTTYAYDIAKNTGASAFAGSGFKPTAITKFNAVETATGTASLSTMMTYDALYRPIQSEVEYEVGNYATSTTSYGTIANNKETLIQTSTDPRGKITRTVKDALQRPTSVTDAFGTSLASTSQSSYTSTGLVYKSIDPLGRESQNEYDGVGRVIKSYQPDALTGLVDTSSDSDPLLGSPLIQTSYDANSNVISTANPLGQVWSMSYDARNRKLSETQPAVTQAKIVAGVLVETPTQSPSSSTTYDGVGNVLSTTDARGNTTRNFYDQAYRVVASLMNPVTGQPGVSLTALNNHDILTTSIYDKNSNILSLTDGNGNTTLNSYDALNRLVTTTTNSLTGLPNQGNTGDITVTNSYDDAGQLIQVIDGDNHITAFRYDGMGRKTQTIWDYGSAVEQVEQSVYDAVVQTQRLDPQGQITNYNYDDLHRLTTVNYTGRSQDDRQMSYDLVGNLLNVVYPNEDADDQAIRACTQTYDALNRVTSETSNAVTHAYSYDKAGNRMSNQYGNTGQLMTSTYDALNRLATYTQDGNITTYKYDLNGNITQKTLPNSSYTNCTYDLLGRKLTKQAYQSTGGVISSFDYSQSANSAYPTGYDNLGNILNIVETYGRSDINNRTVTNTYDSVYRLTQETTSETTPAGASADTTVTVYDYDTAHNRTSKQVAVNNITTQVETYEYGDTTDSYNSNQLKSVDDGTVITTFTYDDNGNRSVKLKAGAPNQSYIYDYDNRLVSVFDNNNGDYHYLYDHRTRRVGRDESAVTVDGVTGTSDRVVFSGGTSAQEYVASNMTSPVVEYIRGSDYGGGIGGVLYTIRDGNEAYNYYNSRGDVVSQTNNANQITWQSSYEAFGTRTQELGENNERQKANTKDEDSTGLLNEGMRYRDLEFGIFLTRDPLGFVDGPNVYTYVTQNPWTMFDPLGLSSDDNNDKERDLNQEVEKPQNKTDYRDVVKPSLDNSLPKTAKEGKMKELFSDPDLSGMSETERANYETVKDGVDIKVQQAEFGLLGGMKEGTLRDLKSGEPITLDDSFWTDRGARIDASFKRGEKGEEAKRTLETTGSIMTEKFIKRDGEWEQIKTSLQTNKTAILGSTNRYTQGLKGQHRGAPGRMQIPIHWGGNVESFAIRSTYNGNLIHKSVHNYQSSHNRQQSSQTIDTTKM